MLEAAQSWYTNSWGGEFQGEASKESEEVIEAVQHDEVDEPDTPDEIMLTEFREELLAVSLTLIIHLAFLQLL